MAGRCGCSSVGAIGTALAAGCGITATGAGTSASPFNIAVKIDPASGNLVACGGNGLLIPLAPDTDMPGQNLLDAFAGGVGVASGNINLALFANNGTMAGAIGAAVDVMAKVITGSVIVAMDGSGNGDIIFPTPFPTALLWFDIINADTAATPPMIFSLGARSQAEVAFNGTFRDGTLVSSRNIDVCYAAIGV